MAPSESKATGWESIYGEVNDVVDGRWGKCQSLVVCKGVLWSMGTVEGEDSSLASLGATKRIDVLSTCESKSVLRPRNGEALFI